MREIKFRVWDKQLKKIFKVSKIHFKTKWIEVITDGNLHVSDYELMQFSGLKDKNGKEIYEGDIVKVHFVYDVPDNMSRSVDQWRVYLVKYIAPGFSMDSNMEEINLPPEWIKEREIIGTIYENPELLK